MVRDILFDLDDTLFDFQADERAALEKTFAELHIPMTKQLQSRYHVINKAQWEALERGELTREEVKLRRFELLFAELGEPQKLAETAAVRYREYLAEDFHFMEGAPELLRALSGTYRMFLVTNGNLAVQQGRLEKAGIGHYFSGIFISEVLGAEKPNRRFFERAFADVADFARETAVIVGDSLTSDMLGGKKFGIRTIWFHQSENAAVGVQPDYEIHALRELPALLEKL